MYENKIIGQANYFQKSIGDYIPFRIKMNGPGCDKI